MISPPGINLLPGTGEWAYDPVPHRAAAAGIATPTIVNVNAAPMGTRTDYSIAIDQLQAQFPACETVSLIVSWFCNSIDVTACALYPSTNFIGGSAQALVSGTWISEPWSCSGLNLSSPGLVPISAPGGSASYGGTPSDASVVRCIQDLKSRGLRVVFYPFILMDCAGYPWRGRITFEGTDISSAAAAAIARFLGTAVPSQFTANPAALTVAYSGAATDWTFRRMILHYANLCAMAGGVDLFLLGSELRGLETIRGPAWAKSGTSTSSGTVTWDYPFVAGLSNLAASVRSVFDSAGLTRDSVNLKNLVSYSADWSVWMGVQHQDATGQWPHLDELYAASAIDLVSFDNYLPLSDWTTGDGGLDTINWNAPAPSVWPPTAPAMNGLGLTTQPSIYDKTYLKANIEGGEKFNWFYLDSASYGRGADPNGTGLQVSLPGTDRLAQNRFPYAAGQQLLANKQLRWWWNNSHWAVYDLGDGAGAIPRGTPSAWVPQSKSITFAEFGFPTCDRATNQPNVFYDPRSSESNTPFWSVWDPVAGAAFAPHIDDLVASIALEAVVEYWTTDGKNQTSVAGVLMIEPVFMCAWNWDARPFPAFPLLGVWADGSNWPAGTWLGGKGPAVAPAVQSIAPGLPALQTFPVLSGEAWNVRYTLSFGNRVAPHVSGRETRYAPVSEPLWDIELSFDLLSLSLQNSLAVLEGFYHSVLGEGNLFYFNVPAALGSGPSLLCRFDDDQMDFEEFSANLMSSGSIKIRNVRF